MKDKKNKNVFDLTRAGNGGCKCNCKTKKKGTFASRYCPTLRVTKLRFGCGRSILKLSRSVNRSRES